MKKSSFLLLAVFILICYVVNINAADAPVLKRNDINYKKMIKPYKCKFTSSPIKIDGLIAEKAWKNAKSISFYTPIELKKPFDSAKGWMLWDNKYLYIAFKANDQDIWGTFKERDEKCIGEDSFETFFRTDIKKGSYYSFEINMLGTIYDAFNLKKYAGGPEDHRWVKWNAENAKIAVHVFGTLNDPEDKDKYVTMELRIPFSDLPSLKGISPRAGDVWKFNLARNNYSVNLPAGIEQSSTSPASKIDFENIAEWIQLIFVK